MDEAALEKKLRAVNNTQECIETLSLWVLHHKHHSDQIASVWLRCLRKTDVKHRLALLYLCNDVLQRCRKQGRPQFLEAFKKVLHDAGALLDQKDIRKQVDRVFSIWKQRKVYDAAFIQKIQHADRKVMKSPSPPLALTPPRPQHSPEEEETIDFEPTGLVEQVKKVRKLQLDVGAKMGVLSSTKLDISRAEVLASCKDKQHCEQFEKDFDEGIRCLKSYVTAIETSLREHKELQTLLTDGEKYYAHQLADVQLVSNGFRTFAGRVEDVKEGLGRFRIPSPPPLPDDCPSPTDSELDDMIISPERNENRTTSKEARISSDLFNPSSASFMNSDPQIFSQLKDVLRKDSRDLSDVSAGRDEPCSAVSPKTSFPSTPLAPPPMPTGLLAHSPMPAFLGIRPFVPPRHSASEDVNVSSSHQDEIKEVDMEIEEDDDEALPGLEKSPRTARTSNLIELTSSSQDVDLRIRPDQIPLRIPPVSHLADEDERFPPRTAFPPSRVDRPFLLGNPNDRISTASNDMGPSCLPMSKSLLSNSTSFNGAPTPALSVEELLKKIVPSINRSNLTTIVQNKEEPESDIVDPDAYDPEDNFVMDIPRVVYSPPKSSSNIVEVPTSDKTLQKTLKSEISSPDTNGLPAPPQSSRLLLLNQKSNDLPYISDPRPSNSPPSQKIPVEHRRLPLLPSPAPPNLPIQRVQDKNPSKHPDTPRPVIRTQKTEQNHCKHQVPSRDCCDRRQTDRRVTTDQRNHHSRSSRPEDRKSTQDFRTTRGGNPRGRGSNNAQPPRRPGGHRHQADGKGWGASLEGDDRVFGYQHDKIDYLSLPRPVKKTPIKNLKDVKLEKVKSDGSPLKQLAAALKDSQDGSNAPTQQGQETEFEKQNDVGNSTGGRVDSRTPAGRLPEPREGVEGGGAGDVNCRGSRELERLDRPFGGETGNSRYEDGGCGDVKGRERSRLDLLGNIIDNRHDGTVDDRFAVTSGNGTEAEDGSLTQEQVDALEQNVVSVEISELEEGGPADDPMLGQYFDTSSSFIVKDISEEEETPLPIIEIGETDTDLWTDTTILDIDDGYGGTEDSKSIASLLEEPSVRGVPRKATSSGLRGAVVATSLGSRRSSCRDQGAFDEFF